MGGASWGMSGYVKLLRGKGGAGECGLLKQASYPVVNAAPAPPSPPSPPAPPSSTHYEDPKDGCRSDEVKITIQGVQGSDCVPSCTLGLFCPSDVPAGVTAKPQCALQDSSTKKKYCALICTPGSDDSSCGTNASCKSIQGVGFCTYDDDDSTSSTQVEYVGNSEKVVV